VIGGQQHDGNGRVDGPVVVRPATGNDLDAVIDVGRRTWPPTYEPIAGPEYVAMGLAKWWTTDVVTASIRAGRTLVAGDGDRVLGVATFGPQGDDLVLWKLYVLPGEQGRGIGSALMAAVAERAHELGHRRITLSHVEGNTQAAAFYTAHGFTPTHRESGGSGLPDSIWMAKDLEAATDGEPGSPAPVKEQR
jgi:GNAT superfamily N-acetyltransferase